MGETKFTQGPWEISIHRSLFDSLDTWARIGVGADKLCEVPRLGRGHNAGNAHLIAAAPELYGECEKAVPIYREAGYHKEADALEQQLAKARGES